MQWVKCKASNPWTHVTMDVRELEFIHVSYMYMYNILALFSIKNIKWKIHAVMILLHMQGL